MSLLELSAKLRVAASQYGGIRHYQDAADWLDSACKAFIEDQNTDTLRDLNAAHARCRRYEKELAKVVRPKSGA